MLNLNKFYQDNNFKFDKKMAYGVYHMYLVSILPTGNYIHVTINFNKQITREQGANISLKMRELKNSNRALQNAITTNIFQELIIYNSASINEELIPILDKVIDILNGSGVVTCDICPLCGLNLPTDAPFARIKNSAIQAHENCINQLINSTNAMNNSLEKQSKKHLGKSIIFIVLSMLLASSLITLIIFFSKYLLFSIMTGFISYFIARIAMMRFRIPYGKVQIIINLSFSLIAIILSVFAGSIFYGANYLDITYSNMFLNYFSNLLSDNFFVGRNVIFSFLLSVAFLFVFNLNDLRKLITKNLVYRL